MRRIVVALLMIMLGMSATAQKYACVNIEYVMANVPDYAQAQSRLNKYVAEWKQEIEAKSAEIDNLRASFTQEAYLLPENLKRHRETEIKNKEIALKELQRQRFGAGGDLDKKRAELIKPVHDRIYSAIERIAREKNYAFVLDKSGSATVVYVAAKYDISDQVLEMLGVKAGDRQPNSDEGTSQRKKVENNEMNRPKR